MKDGERPETLTVNPSFRIVAFGLLGVIFSGSSGYMCLPKIGEADLVATIIAWCLCIIFSLFSMTVVVMLALLRVVVVVEDKLMVSRPFVFFRRLISFSDIQSVVESKHEIQFSTSGTAHTIFSGDKITLEVRGQKRRVELNSFELDKNYYLLAARLRKLQTKGGRPNYRPYGPIKNQTYGWLLLLGLSDIGLLYSIIYG